MACRLRLEVVVILVALSQLLLVKDVPYTRPRKVNFVGAALQWWAWAASSSASSSQEGGGYVGLLLGIGAVTLVALAFWLVRRKRRGKPTLLDPYLFKHLNFRIGISQKPLQQITLGGAMIVLPLFLQMTLEYNAMQACLSLAPLSRPCSAWPCLPDAKAASGARLTSSCSSPLSPVGMAAIISLVPRVDSGWYLVIPLLIAVGSGPAGVPAQHFTLAPIAEERVSERPG